MVAYGLLPALALMLALAAGYLKYVDNSVRDAAVARVESMQAAKDSTVAHAVLSARQRRAQLNSARDLLTGSFKGSYTSLINDVVIPGAKQQQISAVATVPRAASVSADPNHAVVLVFVNQTVVVGTEAPTNTASSVRVTLDKQRRQVADLRVPARLGRWSVIEPRRFDVVTPDVTLRALTWGPEDGPIALCLHGFPDTAHGWRKVAPVLAEAGWRVVAPFMRGYAPSSLSSDGSYQVGALMDDALRVLDAAGPTGRDVLIGHDWGAMAGAGLAAMPDSPFDKAVIMSVPPSASFRGKVPNVGGLVARLPRQLLRSWYIMYFQLPWLPERSASWVVPRLWRRWSPGYDADRGRRPGARRDRRARELARRASATTGRPCAEAGRRNATPNCTSHWLSAPRLPTLYLHGADDGAATSDFARWVGPRLPEGSHVEIVDGAGHFLQLDRPDVVAGHILDFVAALALLECGMAAGQDRQQQAARKVLIRGGADLVERRRARSPSGPTPARRSRCGRPRTASTHMAFGSAASASSSGIPASSPNPVFTGPGHSVAAMTPVPLSSCTERLGVGQHEGLGRAVGRLAGQRTECADRGDVEYRAAAARDHAWHEPAAQVGHGGDVDLDEVEFGRRVGLGDRPGGAQPGVVDQDVDDQAELGHPIGQGGPLVGLGQVGGQHVGALAERCGERMSLSARRATKTTCRPRRTNSRASSSPIPDDAPVTRTVPLPLAAGSMSAA